ncbi:MAG: type III-B CRISPR module RAMP protein Cmr6, partial [Microcystis sp.]
SDTLKITGKNGQREYDGNLCGKVSGGAKPSPVWIADLGNYQIVTVFGANLNPRQEFIKQLRSNTSPQNFAQIFPL